MQERTSDGQVTAMRTYVLNVRLGSKCGRPKRRQSFAARLIGACSKFVIFLTGSLVLLLRAVPIV